MTQTLIKGLRRAIRARPGRLEGMGLVLGLSRKINEVFKNRKKASRLN